MHIIGIFLQKRVNLLINSRVLLSICKLCSLYMFISYYANIQQKVATNHETLLLSSLPLSKSVQYLLFASNISSIEREWKTTRDTTCPYSSVQPFFFAFTSATRAQPIWQTTYQRQEAERVDSVVVAMLL